MPCSALEESLENKLAQLYSMLSESREQAIAMYEANVTMQQFRIEKNTGNLQGVYSKLIILQVTMTPEALRNTIIFCER